MCICVGISQSSFRTNPGPRLDQGEADLYQLRWSEEPLGGCGTSINDDPEP